MLQSISISNTIFGVTERRCKKGEKSIYSVDRILRLKQMVNKISFSCIWKSLKKRLDWIITILSQRFIWERQKKSQCSVHFNDLFFLFAVHFKWYRNSVENVIRSPFWKQVFVHIFSVCFVSTLWRWWTEIIHYLMPKCKCTYAAIRSNAVFGWRKKN